VNILHLTGFAVVYVLARNAPAPVSSSLEPLDPIGAYVIVSPYLAFAAILYFIGIHYRIGPEVVCDPDVMAAGGRD